MRPLTGELLTAADRLEQVVVLGEAAERLGSTANAIQPREAYARLIPHYRERFEAKEAPSTLWEV